MWFRQILTVAVAVACLDGFLAADDSTKKGPRRWDQEKAVAKVKAVLAQEGKGDFAWDKIAWMTDVEAAISQSKSERKPIFLYFYLKGENGPAKAPC